MNRSASSVLWRKAAVIGSLWAASEIILGSFLKNARIPLAGVMLTGIGVAILVAGHRLWPEKGLLWRAGLICAVMKSVSPSAVLLSPMVAIFVEGLLTETAVRLLGGNAAGYLLAGGLAMSWGLFHKAGKLYVFYGPESLAVYARGLEKLREWIGQPGGVWGPLLLLLALYFAAGMAAAVVGMRASREGKLVPLRPRGRDLLKPRAGKSPGYYSVVFLAAHLAVLAALMVSGSLPLWSAASFSVAYGLVCALFYPRAAALLSRTGMWTGIALVSVLAGLLLGDWPSGLRMAARAFALSLGFAAVAQELLNPRIRRALERLAGPVFFETLEYSFATLPLVLSSLPAGRDIVRRPAAALRTVIAGAPALLAGTGSPVFVITGDRGSGKSSLAAGLAGLLREAGKRPAGIIAEGLWENGVRSGFDLLDLSSGSRTPLARRGHGGTVRTGNFGFLAEGISAGEAALSDPVLAGADAVFMDEIGSLELGGGGWAPRLERLLHRKRAPLILCVRDSLLGDVLSRWNMTASAVFKAGENSPRDALAVILARIP